MQQMVRYMIEKCVSLLIVYLHYDVDYAEIVGDFQHRFPNWPVPTWQMIHRLNNKFQWRGLVGSVIFSMPRADASYPYHYRIDSMVFKDNESKTEVKTRSGHRVHPLLVGSLHSACKEHALSSLFAHYAHTHMYNVWHSSYY